MGTSKKIMLASLVSVMLVLAFIIGLVPAHDTMRSSAGDGGAVDMVQLLDLVLGDEKALPGSTLTSPVDDVVVKTPEDNAALPEIPVPVQLDSDGSDIGTITFVANADDDPAAWSDPAGVAWEGDVFGDALQFPYAGALDLSSFVASTAVNTQTSVRIYALLDATAAATKASRLVYVATNDASDALNVTVSKRVGTIDNDDNALPDDVFNEVGPGEIWISNQVINGVVRRVLIANADSGAVKAPGTVLLTPAPNVSIEAPNLDALVADGLVGAGEGALILVQIVEDLGGLLDNVDGDSTPAALAAWASGVQTAQPGGLTDGGEYIDITILATDGASTVEVEDLSAGTSGLLTVTLNVTGLSPGINTPALYSYPTSVTEVAGDVVYANTPGDQSWSEIGGAVFAGSTLSASLQTLSVFAPLNSGIDITGVSTDTLPQNFTADVTITGVFPTAAALNIAQAAAAYRVYVGGVLASFRDGDPTKAEVAITAYDGSNPNTMYITAPASAVAGVTLDLEVADAVNPGNNAVLADAFAILATGTVATAAVGSLAGVSFALAPANGPGLPAGAFFEGASVAVTATLDPTETIAGWSQNGSDLGTTANPVNITVAEGINAVIATVDVAGFGLVVTEAGTGGGSVGLDPAQPLGGYTPGTVVTLTATPDAGSTFDGWTGANAGELFPNAAAAIVAITMNGDKALTANFNDIPDNEFSVTATVNGIGGTAAVTTPPNGVINPANYVDGTVVTIEATAAAGFEFDSWSVAGGTAADANAATTTVTVAGANIVATASFEPVLTTNITGITPNTAWLFGGIVATVEGSGLQDGMTVTIGGRSGTGFRAAGDGSSIDVLVPASDDASTLASFAVDVEVTPPAGFSAGDTTLENGFTYKRYDTDGDGVNYTAFIVDNNAVGQSVDVTLGAPHTNFGELNLPALDTTDPVFGLARNAQIPVDDKVNTPALAALGTAGIEEGDQIGDAFDFSVHLYTAVQEAKNTPPAGSALFGITSGAGLVQESRPIDSQGNAQASTPMTLTFPINGVISDTGLTYDNVGDGLTMWGSESFLDYATNDVFQSDPVLVEYQSQILNEEVDPARTAGSDPAGEPNLVREARLYSLNGFSLRQNAVIDEAAAAGVRLDTPAGTASDSTPDGPTDGGTELRIISPAGGLGFVDRVEFVAAGKQLGGTVSSFLTAEGTNEYELELQAPASDENGIVDIVIYMKANPAVAAATLERAYEYVAEPRPVGRLFLLLLGVLIAILGLAAGGDSGGGGGGPCFIATAAYGSPMAAQIDTLRDVRDEYLLTNAAGTAFTGLYYQVSPAIADTVAQYPALAALVRVLLVPVLFVGKAALAMPVLTAAVGLSLGMWFILRSRKARKA